MYINEQRRVSIHGVPQYISVRAQKKDAPLLLYLHGGPGDAALPLVLKYNAALEAHFTVVVWEQRGAGKSYYPFGTTEHINIALFLDDLYALVLHLLACYGQEALYLVGHSWGSVLGLSFVAQHPAQVRAYIGCGQVVNVKKSCQLAYDFALARASARAREKLTQIDCSYAGPTWFADLLYVTGQVIKGGGSLYGKRNYLSLTLPFLFSTHYSLLDLIRRQKGSVQSIRRLWPELMTVDFEGQTEFEVPVVFVEGAQDKHVSSDLAKAYFDTIQTEKRWVCFEKACHFPHWSQADQFNSLLIDLFAT